MSLNIPYSTQSSIWPPQDREELNYSPQVNTGFLDAHAGSSTLEEVPGYDQVETWLLLVQVGQQPNFPPDETQSQGIRGHFTTQSATEDGRNRTTGCTGKPRPACGYCSKDFGRIQELERHVKDVHQLPHQCQFCPFMWTRPGKLKDHLMADHAERFSPEILEKIKPLRGQDFVKSLDEYVRRLDVGATSQPMVQAPLIPGPFQFEVPEA